MSGMYAQAYGQNVLSRYVPSYARHLTRRSRKRTLAQRSRRRIPTYTETKYQDDEYAKQLTTNIDWDTAHLIDWNSSTDNLVGVGQGSGVNQRIGDRIYVKSIDLKYTVHQLAHNSGTTATVGGQPRAVYYTFVVLDREMPGTAPNFNEIFEANTTNYPVAQRPRNMDNIRRFKILKKIKQTMVVDANIDSNATPNFFVSNGVMTKHFRIVFKKPLRVDFKRTSTGSTARTDSDIDQNGIYVFTVCAFASLYTTNQPPGVDWYWNTRIRYTG